ncbi:MAG TPA: hypothetical protein PKM50_05180 [Methanoregula sp.]|nr:hypothetical protein [Methanoregula sp.]
MDTGKIMMGTALLLIMTGLIIHPAGAVEPGDIPPVGQEIVAASAGPVPAYSEITCMSVISESCHNATHPYKR